MGDENAAFSEMKPHHVGISIPDLEASIDWYCNVLGFTVVKRGYIPEAHTKNAYLRYGDFYVELFQPDNPIPLPDDRRYPTKDVSTFGTKHIAFKVKDLKQVTEVLKKKGVEFAMARPDGTVHFIRDNSGILLEFMPPDYP